MQIEIRTLHEQTLDDFGDVGAMFIHQPIAKIPIPLQGKNLKAVCLGGQWFVRVEGSYSDHLEKEWSDAA